MKSKKLIQVSTGKVRVVEIADDWIMFDNGIKIRHYHDQDCCENVYADWPALRITDIMQKVFKEIVIKGVPEIGILINGYLVPCYNEQNGYYSDELELIIERAAGVSDRVDVSGFVKDDIYP